MIKPKLSSLNILRFGTSGSLQEDIPVDSFVAGTHGLGFDNVMHFYQAENNEAEQHIIEAFKTHTSLNSGNVIPYIFQAVKNCYIFLQQTTIKVLLLPALVFMARKEEF